MLYEFFSSSVEISLKFAIDILWPVIYDRYSVCKCANLAIICFLSGIFTLGKSIYQV